MTQSTFPSQPEESPQEKKGFFQRNAFAIKLALIGTLVLLLLIPLAMVDSLVYQRESANPPGDHLPVERPSNPHRPRTDTLLP